MTNPDKSMLKSKTIFGGVLLVLPAVWSILGIDPLFTADELNETIKQALLAAEALIGFALVVKGRFDANKGKPVRLI